MRYTAMFHLRQPRSNLQEGRLRGCWVITYCDMITILLACFICILTLASKTGANLKRAGQPVGAGNAGAGMFRGGSDASWLLRPRGTHEQGNSETAPVHSDPSLQPTDQIQQVLDDPAMGTLRDSYRVQVPLDVLFGVEGTLTTGGKQTLDVLARNVRPFPYDIQVLVEEASHLERAVAVAGYFAAEGGIHPGRVGVGVQPGKASGRALVWIIFLRNS